MHYILYLFTNKQTQVLLKWDQSSIKGGCILQCFHCDFKTQRHMQNRRCVMIWNMLLWKICLLKVNGLGFFFFFFFFYLMLIDDISTVVLLRHSSRVFISRASFSQTEVFVYSECKCQSVTECFTASFLIYL